MKILEHGQYPQWWILVDWRCECGCVFRVDTDDRVYSEPIGWGTTAPPRKLIDCPECSQTVSVSNPRGLRELTMDLFGKTGDVPPS